MNTIARLSVAFIFLLATNAYGQGPYLTASKFGPTDQIGNLNYVDAAKTLAASKLITKGKTYRLAIETNKNTPAYPPRSFAVTIVSTLSRFTRRCHRGF